MTTIATIKVYHLKLPLLQPNRATSAVQNLHNPLHTRASSASIRHNGAQDSILGRFWYPESHEALCNPSPNERLTGIATRFLQLGIEMRPFFQRGSLWVYTLFAGVGGSFGYWMKGVEDRQVKMLQQRKEILIEKRRRRAEREAVLGPEEASVGNVVV